MRITIEFTPHKSTIVTDLSQDDKFLLYEFLAYQTEGYWFSPKFQSGIWDGFSRLFNTNHQSFASGLTAHVVSFLEGQGHEVEITGYPASRPFSSRLLDTGKPLREYQIECASTICDKRFGIIRIPPRGGKTLIAAAVLSSEAAYPSVFFCRSIDLANQARSVFQKSIPNVIVGLVGDGACEIGDITIITIQSAFNAFNKTLEEKRGKEEAEVPQKSLVRDVIRNAKIVFYDEFHHAGAKTSTFILAKCQKTTMMVGLSATPFTGTSEDIVVEGICGPVLYDVSYSYLIKHGYLLRPYVTMCKLPKIEVEGNYQSVYKQAVVDNEYLNRVVKRLVDDLTRQNLSVVIQTEFKTHSKKLGKLLNAPVLLGDDSTEVREREKQRLASKENLCLVSTLYEEGVDLPELDYTINLAGNISDITTLQRMRSMTVSDGKTSCGVIDFIHSCKYLSRHSRARKACYEAEPEFVVTVIKADKILEKGFTHEDASIRG